MTSLLKIAQTMKKYSLRYNIDYKVTDRIKFADRIDLTAFRGEKFQAGIHFYHEVLYESLNKKIDASLRLAAFSVPVWDARIYSYERDMLYGYSVPVCYGQGLRWYINIHINPFRSVDLWLRLSQTRYLDRDMTGEGPDTIKGPSKSEAKVQIRWRF